MENLNIPLIASLRKATIEMVLLKLLSEKDMYGYEIVQTLCQRSNDQFIIKEGTMYPILYRLTDQQLISSYEVKVGKRQTRVYYHLEEKGHAYYNKLVDYYESFNEMIKFILQSKEGAIYENKNN